MLRIQDLSTPIIINAANEVLVDLFLKGKIDFLDHIVKMINEFLSIKSLKNMLKEGAKIIRI